ncbi:GNAT family N-acetyltransferase [Luteimonas sp. RIT-PG2_3]
MSRDMNLTLLQLPGFPLLQSRRLRLRAPDAGDADAVFALFSASEVMRYWRAPAMTRRDQAVARIDEILAQFERRDMINWVIATRAEDRVVGTLSLHGFDARRRRVDIGYSLHPGYWRQGLATEATTLALDWTCRTLDVERIQADIDPGNARSRQLLLRQGFSSEGLRDRAITGNDNGEPEAEIFGLIATDWRQRASR